MSEGLEHVIAVKQPTPSEMINNILNKTKTRIAVVKVMVDDQLAETQFHIVPRPEPKPEPALGTLPD